MGACKVLAALAALPLLAGAEAGGLKSQCQNFLTNAAASGHSKFEVAALCRAHLEPDVCQRAMQPLSAQQPWSPEMVGETCKVWDAQFNEAQAGLSPERRAETKAELLTILNEVTARKAQVGICKDLAMDKCAAHKAREYPKQTQIILDTLKDIGQTHMPGMFGAKKPDSGKKHPHKGGEEKHPHNGGGGGGAGKKHPHSGGEERHPHGLFELNEPLETGAAKFGGAGTWMSAGLLTGSTLTAAAMVIARRARRSVDPALASLAAHEEGLDTITE